MEPYSNCAVEIQEEEEMNPIPVLGIPHYNRIDLTARCIESIDYPVDKLVIILQGPGSEKIYIQSSKRIVALDDSGVPVIMGIVPEGVGEVICIRHPNAGVAGAWNEIIKLFPAPWWMTCNNDIQFTPGDLQKMAEHVALEGQGAAMIYGNHGASWFAITAFGVQKVGLFDENIYPAYLEDCDWGRRCDLAGERRLTVENVQAIHGSEPHGQHGKMAGSCTVYSDESLRDKNGRTHAMNFEYYRAKWGGNNGEEKFKTPFNSGWPLQFWVFDPFIRARQQWT